MECLFIFPPIKNPLVSPAYFGQPTGWNLGPFWVDNRIYRRNQPNKLFECIYGQCYELSRVLIKLEDVTSRIEKMKVSPSLEDT